MLLRKLSNRLNQAFEASNSIASVEGHSASPAPAALPDPADATSTLCANGELAYDWNILTDRLSWGENAVELLGSIEKDDLSTGLAYAQLVSARSVTTRQDAIFSSSLKDDGYGVLYEAIYELESVGEQDVPTIWVEDRGRWFQGPDGRPARAQGAIRAISDRSEFENAATTQARFEPLTGMLNRAALSDSLDQMLLANSDESGPFAILLIAIDNLFALNCAHGYEIGDEVIKGVATRIRDALRNDDIAARYAGGKFAVVLRFCNALEAEKAAKRLARTISDKPFETTAGFVSSSIRIGAVAAPRHGRSAQALLQHAEDSLDFARLHQGPVASLELPAAHEDRRLRSIQIVDGIVSALNERRVELAFQPIVQAHSGVLAFHEALLRIRLADGKLITPGAILPTAEKAGLVKLLDHRVLDLAISQLVADPLLRISINASVLTLHGSDWSDLFANALAIHPDVGERLILEITETAVIEDFDATRRLIALCKRHGVKIAMDDFGAGHTSFRNLRDLAFDLVKIDGAFVQNLAKSRDDRFFVRTLIELAHHIGMKIVAEWVENEETAQILRELGADYLQGALYGYASASYVAVQPTDIDCLTARSAVGAA